MANETHPQSHNIAIASTTGFWKQRASEEHQHQPQLQQPQPHPSVKAVSCGVSSSSSSTAMDTSHSRTSSSASRRHQTMEYPSSDEDESGEVGFRKKPLKEPSPTSVALFPGASGTEEGHSNPHKREKPTNPRQHSQSHRPYSQTSREKRQIQQRPTSLPEAPDLMSLSDPNGDHYSADLDAETEDDDTLISEDFNSLLQDATDSLAGAAAKRVTKRQVGASSSRFSYRHQRHQQDEQDDEEEQDWYPDDAPTTLYESSASRRSVPSYLQAVPSKTFSTEESLSSVSQSLYDLFDHEDSYCGGKSAQSEDEDDDILDEDDDDLGASLHRLDQQQVHQNPQSQCNNQPASKASDSSQRSGNRGQRPNRSSALQISPMSAKKKPMPNASMLGSSHHNSKSLHNSHLLSSLHSLDMVPRQPVRCKSVVAESEAQIAVSTLFSSQAVQQQRQQPQQQQQLRQQQQHSNHKRVKKSKPQVPPQQQPRQERPESPTETSEDRMQNSSQSLFFVNHNSQQSLFVDMLFEDTNRNEDDGDEGSLCSLLKEEGNDSQEHLQMMNESIVVDSLDLDVTREQNHQSLPSLPPPSFRSPPSLRSPPSPKQQKPQQQSSWVGLLKRSLPARTKSLPLERSSQAYDPMPQQQEEQQKQPQQKQREGQRQQRQQQEQRQREHPKQKQQQQQSPRIKSPSSRTPSRRTNWKLSNSFSQGDNIAMALAAKKNDNDVAPNLPKVPKTPRNKPLRTASVGGNRRSSPRGKPIVKSPTAKSGMVAASSPAVSSPLRTKQLRSNAAKNTSSPRQPQPRTPVPRSPPKRSASNNQGRRSLPSTPSSKTTAKGEAARNRKVRRVRFARNNVDGTSPLCIIHTIEPHMDNDGDNSGRHGGSGGAGRGSLKATLEGQVSSWPREGFDDDSSCGGSSLDSSESDVDHTWIFLQKCVEEATWAEVRLTLTKLYFAHMHYNGRRSQSKHSQSGANSNVKENAAETEEDKKRNQNDHDTMIQDTLKYLSPLYEVWTENDSEEREEETLRGLEAQLCSQVVEGLRVRHIKNVLDQQREEQERNSVRGEESTNHKGLAPRLRHASLKTSQPFREFAQHMAKYDTHQALASVLSKW